MKQPADLRRRWSMGDAASWPDTGNLRWWDQDKLDLPATQDYFLNYFHVHGLQPDVQYRLKSFEMVRTLVGAGIGFSFGFLPLPVTRSYQGNLLLRRPLRESVPGPNVCLAFLEDMVPTRGLEVFMNTARTALNSRLLDRYERLQSR